MSKGKLFEVCIAIVLLMADGHEKKKKKTQALTACKINFIQNQSGEIDFETGINLHDK